ncbi:MAG: hypothetical protein NE334_14130 [Lentisphaeraceae bacterium]|nr:hypothetical protein [Lentisphaeraceae bacterium]
MKNLTCTNCQHTFQIDTHFYESDDMVFDCENCGTKIKKNTDTRVWEAESREAPTINKPKEKVENKPLPQKATTLEKIILLRKLIITCGVLYSITVVISTLSLVHRASFKHFLFALIHTAITYLTVFFINVLLEALSTHLLNQKEIITALKTKS